MNTSKEFWQQRWQQGDTGWDAGKPTTPFLHFFDSLVPGDQRILIPGCGNAYEAEELWKRGFTEVHVADIVPEPLAHFHQRVPDFPQEHLLLTNFFDHTGSYDLILEQTFFCALDPSLRPAYARKMHELIRPKGILTGLYFHFPLTAEGPPFGGSETEYRSLFSPLFEIRILREATDSIAPRLGRELWLEMERKG